MTDTEFQTLVLKKLSNIETDVSELKTDVSVLKTDVSELKTDVSELKTDVSNMKSDISNLQTGQMRFESKLDRMNSDLTDFRESQDGYNDALWKLSNQAFQDIREIKIETIPPWKSAR
jgi:chromosome segregation ATPase